MTEFNCALLENRTVLRVAGPEAHSFLHGLVTQDVTGMDALGQEQAAAFSALLTPQGKILFDFFMIARDDGFLLECDAAHAPALLKRLSLYKLRAHVELALLEGWLTGVVFDRERAIAADGVIRFDDPRLPALGQRLIGPRPAVEAALAPHAPIGACAEYDRRRIELGVPEFSKDFDTDEMFLLDVNYDALNGVSYQKGCFVGQEVTSRMKRKGEIRKRTLLLHFDGDAPSKGTDVIAGSSTLGQALSATSGAALALIRLDRLAAAKERGDAVTIAGKEVQITIPDWLERV